MWKGVLKKTFSFLFTIVAVTVLTFFLMNIMPGEQADTVLRHTFLGLDESAQDWQIKEVAQRYNLDQPLLDQYGHWLSGAMHGDLGTSYVYHQPVSDMISIRLLPTISLAALAMLLALALGIPLGIISALKSNKPIDYVVRMVSMFNASMPSFWLALMLIIVFSITFKLFPTSGYGGLQYMILPALALGLHPAAVITRMTRTSVLETLGQQYIVFARAKGLPVSSIISRHVLKNALLPTLTVLGIEFGGLLGGTVIIESIFNWPGLGNLLANSVLAKDIPVVMGVVVVIVIMFVLVSLVVDVLYTLIDPRIRSG
ncbi:MAG: ABC transporter permease [Methanomassiliicoccus sp.]|nr:ABC transporter permease [Methanomassiliicoccus sp.]